jgi:hypothetical protein
MNDLVATSRAAFLVIPGRAQRKLRANPESRYVIHHFQIPGSLALRAHAPE